MSRNAFAQCEREYNEAEDLKAIAREEREAMFKDYLTTETGNVTDSIVDSVRNKLHQRSLRGISKYGVTLNRTDLSELDWLRHAQEEMLDGANYLEVLIQAKEKQLGIRQ